jgi:2,4-dienoyl-CoA reductase (NADPH2)
VKPNVPAADHASNPNNHKSKQHTKQQEQIDKKELQKRGVQSISGVSYEKIDDDGLHLKLENGSTECLKVDQIVVCAGQLPVFDPSLSIPYFSGEIHWIGGVKEAKELDAKKAIKDAAILAASI